MSMKFAEIKENQVLAQKQAKLASLESSLDKMETALGAAREATKQIKYDNTATDIIVALSGIADEVGIDEKELDYYANDVRRANNKLESAIYGMEEVFEDRVRDLKNAVDDLQMEIDYPEDYD